MKADKLFELWFELKDKKSVIDKEYKEKCAKISEAQEKIKLAMDKIMNDSGSDTLKVKGVGVAFPEIKEKVSCHNADEFRSYIVEQIAAGNEDAIVLLNAAANQKNCRDWFEEEGELPSGVELIQNREIVVRKSK